MLLQSNLTVEPLDASRWDDLMQLFGNKGACGGCWCMAWRLLKSDFDRGKGEGNKSAFKNIVMEGLEPGLLAYYEGVPVGWIAVAPRPEFKRLEKSKVLKPVDEHEVWSITCFFIAKGFRKQKVSQFLIQSAVEFVKQKGGKIVEGYPNDLREGQELPPPFVWTGLVSAFLNQGFEVAVRRSETSPIVRYYIGDQ